MDIDKRLGKCSASGEIEIFPALMVDGQPAPKPAYTVHHLTPEYFVILPVNFQDHGELDELAAVIEGLDE